MKRTLITFILLAAMSAIALAESSDCHNPGGIVPDGRPTYTWSQFPSDAHFYWRFAGQADHSYSVELNYDFTDSQAADGPKSTMVLYGDGDDACSGNSTLGYAWIGDHAPTVVAPSHRYAFVAPVDGFYTIDAKQQHGHSGVFSFRVVDTTMFNPRWSTYANFSTQWGFSNNSNGAITGYLSIYDNAGRLLKNTAFIIPAKGVKIVSSAANDLNLPNDKTGTAAFAYLGPPGSIQADAFFLNSSATVIVPTKFEPRNPQW